MKKKYLIRIILVMLAILAILFYRVNRVRQFDKKIEHFEEIQIEEIS